MKHINQLKIRIVLYLLFIISIIQSSLAENSICDTFPQKEVKSGSLREDSMKATKPRVPVYTVVQESPDFPGGHKALTEFIEQTLIYPKEALKNKIQGRCVLVFTINEDGSISDIQVVRSLGYGCDEEAIEVVKSMPLWKPGRQSGEFVKVRFTLPVAFRIEGLEHLVKENSVYFSPEKRPEFYGGNEALLKFINDNMIYPYNAKANNIEGKTEVKFIVREDGSLDNIKVTRKLGYGCDEESIRLLKSMPKWIPAQTENRDVSAWSSIVIDFKLKY